MNRSGNPQQDRPHRLVTSGLVIALAGLIVVPIVLVLLVAERPDRPAPVRPVTAPPSTAPASADPQVARPAGPAQGPALPRRRRPRRVPGRPPSAPPGPAEANGEPASPPCRAAVLSTGTTVYGPWNLRPDGIASAALPAPRGHRYLLVRLGLENPGPQPVTLDLGARDSATPPILLALSDATTLAPLGIPRRPPDLIEPFDVGRVSLRPAEPRRELTVAFLVPDQDLSADLRVWGHSAGAVAVQQSAPPAFEQFLGDWRKVPQQRLQLHYGHPVLDALADAGHGLLVLRRDGPRTCRGELPFSGVQCECQEMAPQERNIRMTLQREGAGLEAAARLADDGAFLVLDLGEGPAERIVYRRR